MRPAFGQDASAYLQSVIEETAQAGDRDVFFLYDTYAISRPLVIPPNITLRGPATIVPFGGYEGPMLAIGLPNPSLDLPLR